MAQPAGAPRTVPGVRRRAGARARRPGKATRRRLRRRHPRPDADRAQSRTSARGGDRRRAGRDAGRCAGLRLRGRTARPRQARRRTRRPPRCAQHRPPGPLSVHQGAVRRRRCGAGYGSAARAPLRWRPPRPPEPVVGRLPDPFVPRSRVGEAGPARGRGVLALARGPRGALRLLARRLARRVLQPVGARQRQLLGLPATQTRCTTVAAPGPRSAPRGLSAIRQADPDHRHAGLR